MTQEPSTEARELLPCPFCGGEPKYIEAYWREGNSYGDYVLCTQCGARNSRPLRVSDARSIAAWNTRASIPPATVPDDVVERAKVPWHSPLGGLLEAQTNLRNARRSVDDEKRQNTHVPGNPYGVAEVAINSALAEVQVLIDKALSTVSLPQLPADLVELSAKATGGEWKHYDEVFRAQFSRRRVTEIQRAKDGKAIVFWPGFDGLPSVTARKRNANAAFIVAAVNFVRSLIDQQQKGEG